LLQRTLRQDVALLELLAAAARPEESLVPRPAARRPRRPRRLAAAILAAAGAALSLITAAAPASAAPAGVRYIALGDSYSSGLGAGFMISSSGACDRSTKAYSRLWDLAHRPAAYRSVACAGATTTTVISSQLSALSASTTLVSITVGGNYIDRSIGVDAERMIFDDRVAAPPVGR